MTDDVAAIRRPFLVADLERAVAATGVTATVVVQAATAVEETRALLEMAAGDGPVTGVVGWVDLTAPDVAEALAALREGPGGERLVGIRHPAHDEPDPRWLCRADVRRGLAAVAGAGLPHDLLVRTRELPAAVETARALDGAAFILDHLGKPPLAGGDVDAWSIAFDDLAACGNVTAKVSGLVTEARWDSWETADLRTVVDRALDRYGPDRLMFGSDWPVCLLAADYEAVVQAARDCCAGLTAAERHAVFGATARRVYDLT